MTIEAMKLALDALEFLELEIFVELDKSLNVGPTHGRKAIIALRAAIEQAQGDGVCRHCNGAGCVACDARHLPEQEPRRWQGLTEEEIARREQVDPIRVRIMQEAYDLADRNDSEGYNSVKVMCSEVLSMIDRLLDEPVYEANEAFAKRQEWWNNKMFEMEAELQRYKKSAAMWRNKAYEAAGHPLPWKPDELWQGLTDEEIDELALDENGLPNSHIEFARAIEAKLKEKNG